MSKGYVVVASTEIFYYYSALNLIHSIKDFDPNAKVCLVAEERFLDKGSDVADDIKICIDHPRSKLWGMANSPYDQSFYIDADCEIVHEDLPTVFDKFGDNDILFTALTDERSYMFREFYWGYKGEHFDWCGGTCLYDMTKPLIKDFMQDWYDLTVKQYAGTWWPQTPAGYPDTDNFPRSLSRWDQFSLWWLINKTPKYENLKIGRLDGEDDARWNYFAGYVYDHAKNPVVMHYSNSKGKNEMRDKYSKS
tara:strand:- start:6544 stop:7293 length:750 start_codon:yes stop_codon:yes gene_type:complete